MILYINTTKGNDIEIVIKDVEGEVAKEVISAPKSQAEKLLPLIIKTLEKAKLDLYDIKEIEVANNGGSFTALRIGVSTANALGYALNIPVKGLEQENKKTRKQENKKNFDVIKPIYDREPDITKKKSKIQ